MLGGFWRFMHLEGDDSMSSSTPNIRRLLASYTDFSDNVSTKFPPFSLVAVASGTCAYEAAEAGHPGIVSLNSATGANSGIWLYAGADFIVFSGGEVAELIFKLPATPVAAGWAYFGFSQQRYPVDAVNGAWFAIAGALLAGKTEDNGSVSTTGTDYTLTGDTWYHLKLVVNDDATRVDFYLYDANGTVLWTDNLTTNIPVAAGRVTRPIMSASNTAAEAATQLIYLDAMAFYGTKDIR